MSLTSALSNATAGLSAPAKALQVASALSNAAGQSATSDFPGLLQGLGGSGDGVSNVPTSLLQPASGAAIVAGDSCAAAATAGQLASASMAYTRSAQAAYSAASAVATGVNKMFHTLAQA